MGDLTLTDFDSELMARGFDAFDQPTRYRYINWGYRRIAKRSRWKWEQTQIAAAMVAGDVGIGVTSGTADGSHPIGNFKSITRVYITLPANRRAKLRPLSDKDFFNNWLNLDLTLAAQRNVPESYYFYNNLLYILPPPNGNFTVTVHFKQQVVLLVAGTDKPVTPPDMDEAILTAALVRCHKRANEIQLSQQSAGELEAMFDEMATDEAFEEEEQPERVSPDDQWL